MLLSWFHTILATPCRVAVKEAVYDYANVAGVPQGNITDDTAASLVLQQNAAYSKSASTQRNELQCDTSVLQLEDHPPEG